jgi:carboxymethylenebutenolidase
MDKKITNLYDDYSQGRTNRRDFFRKLAMLAGSTSAALALLPILEENKLKASANLQDDPDLLTEFIKYPGETGDVRGFLAWPKAGKKFPAVIVIHENRGLVPHIQDVTRRIKRGS